MSRSKRARNFRPARTGELNPQCGSFLEAVEAGLAEADPRALSLCSQAHRALETAIGMECRDENVNELVLLDVVPDPTVRRLRVWLGAPRGTSESERDEWMHRLMMARGFLRSRVAEAIHRKRTTELVFELVIPQAQQGGPDAK